MLLYVRTFLNFKVGTQVELEYGCYGPATRAGGEDSKEMGVSPQELVETVPNGLG